MSGGELSILIYLGVRIAAGLVGVDTFIIILSTMSKLTVVPLS